MFIKLIIIAVAVQLVYCDGVDRCAARRKKIGKREVATEVPFVTSRLFQGDIELTTEQEEILAGGARLRTGTRDMTARWPKNKNELVIIPYTIRDDSGFTVQHVGMIKAALDKIEAESCVRFVERMNEDDYIEFFSGGGCFSKLGKVGGRQTISIRKDHCMEEMKIIHEVLHALGFTHMHNRIDRDNYIQIYPENLMYSNWLQHFDKIDSNVFSDYGTPYDLLSVLHYPTYAFARGHEKSILPCNSSYDNVIGNVKEMSRGDIVRLNRMYECYAKP